MDPYDDYPYMQPDERYPIGSEAVPEFAEYEVARPTGTDDYEWYRPGLFARLAASKTLIIVLIIAFVLLVVGPSLFYIFNPPKPRPPLPVHGQGIPT